MSHDQLWARYQRSMLHSEGLREANRLLAGQQDEADEDEMGFRFSDGGGDDDAFGSRRAADDADDDALFASQSTGAATAGFFDMGERQHDDEEQSVASRHEDEEQRDRVNMFSNINDLLEMRANEPGDDDGLMQVESPSATSNHSDDDDVISDAAEPNFLVDAPPTSAAASTAGSTTGPLPCVRTDLPQEEQLTGEQYRVGLMMTLMLRYEETLRQRRRALDERQRLHRAAVSALHSELDPLVRFTQQLWAVRKALREQKLRTLGDEQLRRLSRHLDYAVVAADVAGGGSGADYPLYHTNYGPYLILVIGDEHHLIVHQDYLR